MLTPIVVICDDETELVSELAEWFEGNGWVARRARDAEEALTQLMNGRAATCLVTDRYMPLTSGDTLAELVGTLPAWRRPELVVVMTGDSSASRSPDHEGIDMVLIKPVDPGAMLRAITGRLDPSPGRPPRIDLPLLQGTAH